MKLNVDLPDELMPSEEMVAASKTINERYVDIYNALMSQDGIEGDKMSASDAIAIIAPAALVVLTEHIGHLMVTGNIVGRDLMKEPGLDRSLFADGCSNILSGLFGATPNTTYGENIGVMAITKVYSVWVIGGAAVFAILLSFIGKLSQLIHGIPGPVMGGVCMLLFGVIAASGFRLLVEQKVDYSKSRNLTMTAVVMIVGLSGAKLTFGTITVQGMVLATLVAILLSLLFHLFEHLGLMEE